MGETEVAKTAGAVGQNRGVEVSVSKNWQRDTGCHHLELVACPEDDIHNGTYDERDW